MLLKNNKISFFSLFLICSILLASCIGGGTYIPPFVNTPAYGVYLHIYGSNARSQSFDYGVKDIVVELYYGDYSINKPVALTLSEYGYVTIYLECINPYKNFDLEVEMEKASKGESSFFVVINSKNSPYFNSDYEEKRISCNDLPTKYEEKIIVLQQNK